MSRNIVVVSATVDRNSLAEDHVLPALSDLDLDSQHINFPASDLLYGISGEAGYKSSVAEGMDRLSLALHRRAAGLLVVSASDQDVNAVSASILVDHASAIDVAALTLARHMGVPAFSYGSRVSLERAEPSIRIALAREDLILEALGALPLYTSLERISEHV